MKLEDAIKLIAKLLNITEAKVQSYIDSENVEESVEALLELNRNNLKGKLDEGHKKGLKQATKKLVDTLKSEFDLDISGDTPEAIAESLKGSLESRSADDISEETIKVSQAYKDLQAQLTRETQDRNKLVEKEVSKQIKEKKKEFDEGLKKAKRGSIDSRIEAAAKDWLIEQKAILPSDPAEQKLFIKDFAKKLASDDIEEDEDGNFLISQNGSPVINKEGHNATLSDRFSNYKYLFARQSVQQRESSQLDPNGGGGSGQSEFKHFKGVVPTNAAEMSKIQMDFSNNVISPEAYKEAKAAYKPA